MTYYCNVVASTFIRTGFTYMWLIVAKKEIKETLRGKIFVVLSVVVWVLLLFAAIGGYKTYSNVTTQQKEARAMFQRELAQKDRNPHSAAHFGTWLFKPLTALSLFDPGVNDYTGSTYRVEAHKQSEMNFAVAKDSDSMMRFGSLSVATLFQLFLPLVVIFLCASSMSKEYETGTLKMLYAQGASKRSLLWGKILGNYSLMFIAILPAFLIISVTGFFDGILAEGALFIFCYVIYLFLWVAISVLVSDMVRHSGPSLLLQLCMWIFFCIGTPKIIASTANSTYPLPSYYAFSKLVDKDFYNGLDGDGSYAQRREKLEKETLEKYGVDSISQLPINLNGLLLQDAEDYMSRSYRQRSVPVNAKLEQQQKVFRLGAFISPYLSIKQLSRGFAGTDVFHHRDFHREAGIYRDEFIRTLNLELAKSNRMDGHYAVSAHFLGGMRKFDYKSPSTSEVIRSLLPVEISMLYWLGMILLLIELSIIKTRK